MVCIKYRVRSANMSYIEIPDLLLCPEGVKTSSWPPLHSSTSYCIWRALSLRLCCPLQVTAITTWELVRSYYWFKYKKGSVNNKPCSKLHKKSVCGQNITCSFTMSNEKLGEKTTDYHILVSNINLVGKYSTDLPRFLYIIHVLLCTEVG